jgi:hypothetical protein
MAHQKIDLLVGRNSKQRQYIPIGRGGQVNWIFPGKLVCQTKFVSPVHSPSQECEAACREEASLTYVVGHKPLFWQEKIAKKWAGVKDTLHQQWWGFPLTFG